jgi:acetyl esterase
MAAQLTKAMRGVLDRIALAGHAPLHAQTAAQARNAYARGCDVLEVRKALLDRVQDLHVTARDGTQLPARLYAPSHDKLPVMLFMHGGGFTIGSVQTHDILCRELSRLSGVAVLSLDYRLAPEHTFPTAANDAWDALQWLAGQGTTLGLDTRRIAVGGDSAGGTLATVCALQARDAGLSLALQLLFYPGCAAFADSASHQTYAQGYLLTTDTLNFFFKQYLPDVDQRVDWRFSPINAPDHTGVAPTWIGLAECDPLVDEGIAYGDVLRLAGVQVDLEIYRGVTHEFIKMGRTIPEAKLAHQHAAAALRSALL